MIAPRFVGARSFGERRRPSWLEWLPRGIRREGVIFRQHIREGQFQRSLALVAGLSSILGGLEVTYEHYRGSYSQRKMYAPVVAAPALLAVGVWTVFSRRPARRALPLVAATNVAIGAIGFAYHVLGIKKRPGGWRVPIANIVMGPPLFAPLLYAVPGYLGLIATFLRREDAPRARWLPRLARPRHPLLGLMPRKISRRGITLEHELREGRFQKHMALSAAAAAFFSGAESLYSHYKNGFQYPSQWTPIAIAPLVMASGVATLWSRRAAHTALPIASALAIADGVVGFWYHGRGVKRRPGGTRHLAYNIMYGPPIFAPLLFAASGFFGLLASLMRRER